MRRVVLHTADWHLGRNRKYNDYLEQQRLMLGAILSLILDIVAQYKDEKVEIWFIQAGDIFDRNEDTNRDEFILPIINILYPLMDLKKNHSNFEFFFVDGNHDRQPYDPTDPDALASVVSPLTKMAEGHIAVLKPKWIEDKKLLLVPFGQYSVVQIHELLAVYPAEFLVMHECCAGITTDVGWKPPRDQDHYIDAGQLIAGAPSLVAVFLGDIHRSQKLDPTGICWYSGSPITLDFGEKMPKGVLIHGFTKTEDKWVRDGQPVLRSLIDYEPRLKHHKQLGVLDKPDKIPFEALAKYKDQYLQFTVTAEVYAQVARQLPQVFESPHVVWDHVVEREVQKSKDQPNDDSDDQTQLSYYQPLIEQWILENGKELTKAEREEGLARILKDFEKRI
jgi:hypothetical protein